MMIDQARILSTVELCFLSCTLILDYLDHQEYVPEYDEITSKLTWEEMDRLNNYVPGSGIPI